MLGMCVDPRRLGTAMQHQQIRAEVRDIVFYWELGGVGGQEGKTQVPLRMRKKSRSKIV